MRLNQYLFIASIDALEALLLKIGGVKEGDEIALDPTGMNETQVLRFAFVVGLFDGVPLPAWTEIPPELDDAFDPVIAELGPDGGVALLDHAFDPNRAPEDVWKDDRFQFMRLLGVLAKIDYTPEQYTAICDAMEIPAESIDEIFGRAAKQWDAYKLTIPKPDASIS
jgi:hypothetical protein